MYVFDFKTNSKTLVPGTQKNHRLAVSRRFSGWYLVSFRRTCPVSLFGEQDGFSVRKTCQVLLENEGEKDAQGPFDENVKNKTPTAMAGVFYSLTE